MSLRATKAKGPYVGNVGGSSSSNEIIISGDDTTPGDGETKLIEGQAVNVDVKNPAGDERLEFSNGNPGFHDTFDEERPFWLDTDALANAFSINTATERLVANGTAGTHSFREHISGDWDYAFKLNSSSGNNSHGVSFAGNSITARYVYQSAPTNTLTVEFTGESDDTESATFSGDYWLRVKREGQTISFYYKEADDDPWTLQVQYTDKEMGFDVSASLDGTTSGNYYSEVILFDNNFPRQVRATAPLEYELTDAATIAVDASLGNVMRVTLGGNRTLGAPTNPMKGQFLLFVVRQDATGSRTLSFNAIYRFSTSLPSPTLTTAAGDVDYLLFRYDDVDSKWDYVGEVLGFTS